MLNGNNLSVCSFSLSIIRLFGLFLFVLIRKWVWHPCSCTHTDCGESVRSPSTADTQTSPLEAGSAPWRPKLRPWLLLGPEKTGSGLQPANSERHLSENLPNGLTVSPPRPRWRRWKRPTPPRRSGGWCFEWTSPEPWSGCTNTPENTRTHNSQPLERRPAGRRARAA